MSDQVWKLRTLITSRQKLEVRTYNYYPITIVVDIIVIVALAFQVVTIIITEAMVG
jgi:hypothetical protein